MKHKGKSVPRKTDSGRQRIVEAARAHFFSHGFRRVTMDDLATELGISKKTLYVHFPDKIKPPFVRDIRQKAPDMFKLVERRRAELIERFFGKLFVEGQRTGMVRKDLPAKLMIEILLGAVQAIVNPTKVEGI